MVIYRHWFTRMSEPHRPGAFYMQHREGWFLCGFLPLYCRDFLPRSITNDHPQGAH